MTVLDIIVTALAGVTVILILYIIYKRVKIMRKMDDIRLSDHIGIAVLVLSLVFVIQVVIVSPMQYHSNTDVYCRVGLWSCIILYVSIKILIYIFLIEAVHRTRRLFYKAVSNRLHSRQYLFNIALLVPSPFVLIWAIMGAQFYIDQDGQCHIGILDRASIILIAYDVSLSLTMLCQLIAPLFDYANDSRTVQVLARENLTGAILSFSTTFINFLMNTLSHGTQAAYACNFWCILDLCVDAVVINWLLARPKETVLKEVSEVVMTVMEDAVVNVIIDQKTHTESNSLSLTSVTNKDTRSVSDNNRSSASPRSGSMIPFFVSGQSSASVFSPSFRNSVLSSSNRLWPSNAYITSIPHSKPLTPALTCSQSNGRYCNAGMAPITNVSISTFRNAKSSATTSVVPSFDQWQRTTHSQHAPEYGTPPLPAGGNTNKATFETSKNGAATSVVPSFDQRQRTSQ